MFSDSTIGTGQKEESLEITNMAERNFEEELEKIGGMEWKLTSLADKSVHLICQGPWTTQKYVFAEMSFKVFNLDRCKKHKVFSKAGIHFFQYMFMNKGRGIFDT